MAKYQKLNINDFGAFDDKNKKYKDGVFTLQLTSWSEFHSAVEVFNNNTDYIWRGQRCYPEECNDDETKKNKWILKSSFDRGFGQKMSNEKERQRKLKETLNKFKKRLEALPNTHNINFAKDYEIWAIGQQHGLSTPLLDWTKSPYIASYFACYEKSREQTNRVVYALNRAVKRLIIKEKNTKTKEVLSKQRKIEFDFDSCHFSPEHHMRFIKQKGTFTKAFRGDDIKSIVKEFWEKIEENNNTEIILTEILIPDKLHGECLSSLESMNITHGTLFPDYAGAVKICKLDLGLL